MKRFRTILALAAAAALVLSTGCVTKKVFRQTVTEQDQKIETVQSGVETNERRVKDVDERTRTEITRLDGKADAAQTRGDAAYQKALDAEKTARGKVLWEVTLSNEDVKFGLNEAVLTDNARMVLDDISQRVKSYDRTVYVEIQGHTDATGSETYNEELGQKRADAAKLYLNENGGIPLHLISAVSLGESKPVADNGTRTGRAQNRRIIVRILE